MGMESKDGDEPVQARSKRAELIQTMKELREAHEGEEFPEQHHWKIMEIFTDTETVLTLACLCGTIVTRVPTVKMG